jgi:nicotinate-nucleotide pyrophosphorylase (carboxylating)
MQDNNKSIFYSSQVRKLIQLALEEDLSYGDITSSLFIRPDRKAQAKILLKEKGGGVVCGLPIIEAIFEAYSLGGDVFCDEQHGVKHAFEEGVYAEEGAVLSSITASLSELLALERTVLNFLQRLSGIASYTRKIVDRCKNITILDTRKTLPGWRVLDKYAARTGGAKNHRMHLGDMILVKNNHMDTFPDEQALQSAFEYAIKNRPFYQPLEVEVRSLEELKKIEKHKPDIIMLDNFNHHDRIKAINYINAALPETRIELSGGIDEASLVQLAQSVQLNRSQCQIAVSMGSLTTHARNIDISMKIEAQ